MSTGTIIVNGYELEDNFSHLESAAQWAFAKKDGKEWFVKRFIDPVCPTDRLTFSEDVIRKKGEQGRKFYQEKRRLYDAVNSCANGNIVTIHDFFLWNSRYHTVMEKINVEPLTMQGVAKLPDDDKLLMMKTLTDSFVRLHKRGIVYADLRPDNILFKKSATGKIISKLIDFDSCFMESEVPPPGMVPISEQYIAPETAEYTYLEKNVNLTAKVDVFSLAIMFHLYWTGEFPQFDKKYDFVFHSVLEGAQPIFSLKIPPLLARLMRKMIQKEPEKRPSSIEVFDELRQISDLPHDNNPPQSDDRIDVDRYFYIPLKI